MQTINDILAKSVYNGGTTLIGHTEHCLIAIEKIAKSLDFNPEIAKQGAILHDIGKTHPVFQERLKPTYRHSFGEEPFRHELASLLFLPLCKKEQYPYLIDMIVAHHKSIDEEKGILDFEDNWEEDYAFERHSDGFNEWSKIALEILNYFGFEKRTIDISESKNAYDFAIKHCKSQSNGWSEWKGLMNAADHFASAMVDKTTEYSKRIFFKPDLSFYYRRSELHPLSLISADDNARHTIVTAPTGAGKTDFLLRRCRSRVFYTLPFQASINAMFLRIKNDLKITQADIRLLHAASKAILNKELNKYEEQQLQPLIGSSVKILTPHQIAGIVFGTKNYEALLLDLKDNDVILDEIHTYSDISQAIVLKIIDILKDVGCRIHIGTATMPSVLYEKIIELLGEKDVYQVKLPNEELDKFNRHLIHKLQDSDEVYTIIKKSIDKKQKILIVCNQVAKSQQLFINLQERFSDIDKMLIHSRFKRKDRANLESDLKNKFNESRDACIVVSTQVVEVSLDISFDVMITDAAPLDSLIQRFGRINRKRDKNTTTSEGYMREIKGIYVIKPSEKARDVKPYDLEIVNRSFDALPNNEILQERDLQTKLDEVFTEIKPLTVEHLTIYKNGIWLLRKLVHFSKAVLLKTLEIDTAICITEGDRKKYEQDDYENQILYEIPVSFKSIPIKELEQSKYGNCPFIIPDEAYSETLGLLVKNLKEVKYNIENQFL